MSESAIIDAMEDHADDPVDPKGRMAKGCEETRRYRGADKCCAVFRCRRCWPFVGLTRD